MLNLSIMKECFLCYKFCFLNNRESGRIQNVLPLFA